ncbi:MAG: hypothetical protein LUD12_13240 [Lachnospiraceae bacterium]|nr:hypothetical protein [Lachnospiraceae bacterium]
MGVSQNIAINAAYLCKTKQLYIGDVEHKVGYTRGYLSRIASSESMKMTVEKALDLAKILNMSVEELSKGDLEKEIQLKAIKEEIEILQIRAKKLEKEVEKNGIQKQSS